MKKTLGNYEKNYNNFKEDIQTIKNIKAGEVQKLITNMVQVINKNLRAYYNFSIADFYELVEGCSNYHEFCKIIYNMDHHKQYTFKTAEEYNDFMDYLLEENELKCFDEVKEKTIQINKNLYSWADELDNKYWIA